MRHFTSRRTIRTTAVTLGAVVALGAPAAAFAADQPTGADQSVSASVVAKRKLVKTQRLVDGSVGKIYKVGDRFEADIFYKGKKIGSLNARTTVLKHHGVNYSFHPYKGTLYAEKAGKVGNPAPQTDERKDDEGITDPIPNPTPDDESGTSQAVVTGLEKGKGGQKLVRVNGLVDGSVAKVYKVGKGYKAEITSKGSRVGTINGRGEITYGETGGLGVVHAKMTPNGKVTSWLTSPKPKPGAAAPDDQQQDDKRQDDVDPQPQPQPLPEDAAPAGV
ncbi:hypothetical protein [Streptomyces sp. Je 1-369]|uniref:hypothetical protein n=1 Tax=Streptomyces sp. Je 1-369 TaxID=2966192 RepID=UPI0022861A55|nr:hypothetical protein [Streptomyces sp. Je 1-369]WAL99199.1 hypothetical protein NOO62_34850 [Streptomyces sp. Je 1-369]